MWWIKIIYTKGNAGLMKRKNAGGKVNDASGVIVNAN